MRIAVAPTPEALTELEALPCPDVLVLWERITQAEAEAAALSHPTSYTVSGEWRGDAIWGVIRQGAHEICAYRKILDDDQYAGLPAGQGLDQSTIIWDAQRRLAVCVLVCRDIDVPGFTDQTLRQLSGAPCTHRILAIPAHMGDAYFREARLSDRYTGFTVALSNGNRRSGARASFISNRVDGMRDGFSAESSGLISAELPRDHERIPIDSPMHPFWFSVRHAPFRWAPSEAAEMKRICEQMQISMGYTDDMDYPGVVMERRRIEIPVYFLENLWATCFAGIAISLHLRERLGEMGTVIQLPDTGDVGAARILLQWSLERAVNQDQMPWPQTLRPDPDARKETTMNTANVVFEIGMGFVLHHELAHVIHDLRVNAGDPNQRRFEEALADQIAAAKYVAENEPDPKQQESRSLGILLVLIHFVGIDVFLVDFCRRKGVPIPDECRGTGEADHPSSVDRLKAFMNDAYFAGTGHCHEICQVMLRAYCTRLRLVGVALEVADHEEGWRRDLDLLEAHIMQD